MHPPLHNTQICSTCILYSSNEFWGLNAMSILNIGDIVVRKSYGSDVYFVISNITVRNDQKPVYILKGLSQRIQADSYEDDLIKKDTQEAYRRVHEEFLVSENHFRKQISSYGLPPFYRMRAKAGKILHIDSSSDLFYLCSRYYSNIGVKFIGKILPESEQPRSVRALLHKHKPDILVLTGHDSMKKGSNSTILDNYSTSRFFIESVKEARKYEPNHNKFCIFAGACQSYFEAIMQAGANFASSPGRVLIHGLDPAIIVSKVATTDSMQTVRAADVIRLTKTGFRGIGGIDTKGHLSN